MKAWHDSGVDVKVEISTKGDVINNRRSDFQFIDSNADHMPDGWGYTWNTSGNSVPLATDVTADGTFGEKIQQWPGSGGSNIWAIGPAIPVTLGCTYRFYADVATFDGSTAPSPSGVGYRQYNSAGSAIWSSSNNGTVTPSSEWAQVASEVSVLQSGAATIAPILNSGMQVSGISGARFRNCYVVESAPATTDFGWRDITCDVKSITVRHGREKYTERYDAASILIGVDNRDGEYRYADPHPFNFRPGRLIRITAIYNSVSYPMAYGTIDSIGDAYDIDGKQITAITAYDVTTLAANQTVPYLTGDMGYINNYSFSSGGKRITALLDVFGYPLRSIDLGGWNQQDVDSSGRSIRDEIGISSDSEGGNFYAERDGRIMYRDRTWASRDSHLTTVTANLTARTHDGWAPVDTIPTDPNAPTVCPNALITEWNQSRIINEVSLANAGGNARVFSNTDSKIQYGVKAYQRHDFVNRYSSDLATRANDYLDGYGDAVLRLNSVSFNASEASAWIWTLTVFLNWLIRVTYHHPYESWGWTIVTHTQSVEHRITPKSWVVSMALDQPVAYIDEGIASGWDIAIWDQDLWDEYGSEPAYWSSGQLWNDPLTIWGPS